MSQSQDRCKDGGPTKQNGNCTAVGPDGGVVQCVGPWAKEKHDYLRRYIDATQAARKKYLTTNKGLPPGGAAFIDLFAGPGRARVRTTGEIIDGSPLIAAQHVDAPFTKLVLVELERENAAALRTRLKTVGRHDDVLLGDCNSQIDAVIKIVPRTG